MAQALAEAGCSVMLSGLETPEEAEPARARMAQATGVDVAYVSADLTRLSDIEALVAQAVASFGTVEILINNAVVRHFAPIDVFPVDHWDRALAVNLSAAFHTTRLLLPIMRAAGFGRIFNMTSVYGSRATTNRVDYVTTKTALQGLTRATALETADSPVTCHALCPGAVMTPASDVRVARIMTEQSIDRQEAESRFLKGKQPNGRFVDLRSVTDMLLLLCGPAGYDMNGAILPIEGGWLAQG